MPSLQELMDEFDQVDSDKKAMKLIERFGLSEKGVPQIPRDNLGTTGGIVDGVKVRLARRWYDPSGPFQNIPDIHKARLELDGKEYGERTYDDK